MSQYSNETLTVLMQKMNKHFEKDGIIWEIKEHVEKTNGRVTQLEKDKSFFKGGMYVMGVVIIPLIGFVINLYI